MIDYEKSKESFIKYLENFDQKDPMIKRKIVHSEKTVEVAIILGKDLGLTDEQIELVKVIALLHDLGRFEQACKYNNYSDIKTGFDHAKEADNYLFVNNHIRDFIYSSEYDNIIRAAIINHNLLKIEESLSEEEEFYVHFLRDVDKIDIFRQDAVLGNLFYKEASSNEVKSKFLNRELIPSPLLKNDSDEIVFQLAYLFDIHFRESLELLVETDNYNLLFDSIEVSREMEEEFYDLRDVAYQYIIDRLESYEEIN